MSLATYRKKRDFKVTAEPGVTRGAVVKAGASRFVIQKHDASRLHYDFRLELGGVLKSWAVPKGMPYEKGEKRLAVEVEDHPVDYMQFEGVIPQGQYGGGTVMVWDCGTYEPLSPSPAKELASGKLHFILHGTKLTGEWYLVRLKAENKQWLMIRGGESMKPVSRKQDDTSVISGWNMKRLAKSDEVWEPNGTPAAKGPAASNARAPRKKGKPANFVEPMKALLVARPPLGDWLYEIKFDGFRALALRSGQEMSLLSRTEHDLAPKFPELMDSLREVKADNFIFDGEVVAVDEKGRSSFQLLQSYELGQTRPPLLYYVFDLLQLDGRNLCPLPLEKRKERLEKLLKKPPGILRYSGALGDDVVKLLAEAERLGLEGLIGKRAGSAYEAGRRSGAWIKLKLHRAQEFVIGGYTPPEGTRKHLGALLVGYYDAQGKLCYAGKVGTGFNHAQLSKLHAAFSKRSRVTCPFPELPEERRGRYGQGITSSVMKKCHWVKPDLVAQIKFSEWTRDGRLRHPVFEGLRTDKPAREVVREIEKGV